MAHMRRATTTSPGGHITDAQPREVLRLTSARARRVLSRTLENAPPARPYRSRRRYARSYGSIHQLGPFVRSYAPGPPESTYLGKAQGDAGLLGGFTPDLSTSLGCGKRGPARLCALPAG